MPKYAKGALWGLGGFLVLLGVCVILLLSFNWNYAKPWVERQIGQAINRPVAIQGDLDVQWQRPPSAKGWARWVPWPRVIANDIRVGNPDWISPEKGFAQAGHVAVTLNPLALLDNTVQIADLQLHAARVGLLRNAEGQNNWTLKKDPEPEKTPSRWKFDIQKVDLQDVSVRVEDATNELDMNTEINSLQAATQEGYGIAWKASGSYNGVPISGEGRSAGVLSLQDGEQPFPLQGDVTIGGTTIALEGSVTRPQTLAALDVRLKLAGDSMSDLGSILGLALPETPPYHTEGHLIGHLDQQEKKWTYDQFKGGVGESDLEGTLTYVTRKPRPLLTGDLQSKLLRFTDLGPLIGVDSSEVKTVSAADKKNEDAKAAKAEDKAAQKEEGKAADGKASDDGKPEEEQPDPSKEKERARPKKVVQPANKALPVAPINTKSWGLMDADVKFVGHKIVRDKSLPLDNVKAHVKLNDSTLTLDPLTFGVAGGDLASHIELDGKSSPMKAKMVISARHLKINQLVPEVKSTRASFGEVHGDASLTAQGDSIASLLGHSNGEIQALVSKGTVSRFLLEAAGLNVANMLLVKLFGDEQITLNCLASDFGVKNGVMTARGFKLDTPDAVVDITGQINLRSEAFDLDVRPENKSVRIFTLRTPLYVKGTFKNPDVGVQSGPLAARAGAAVALGIIATPFAAIVPLLNLGTDDSSECAPLLAAVSDKPKAPPPGVTKGGAPTDEAASAAQRNGTQSKQQTKDPVSSMFDTATDAEKRQATEAKP